ncbi:MAG: TerD family protein [Cyanobacteria bacterium SID2]|nr:TerD family protein [Cyanobacteria bacterium SID2]MBP0005605.1 TerD family protein [Cyanobacteria bacterium SBC]
MGIQLHKGESISLAEASPGLTQLLCGLGWDVVDRSKKASSDNFTKAQDIDLDASVICLDRNGKVEDLGNVVYFGNLTHHSGSIEHLGDNLTGAGEGDDEQITIDLSKIPSEITTLIFTVNIYDCVKRKQDFGQVQNAFIRLVDRSNQKELARYDLSGTEYQGMTGTIVAEIYRHNGGWNMAAVGEGVKVSGLGELVNFYN